MNKIVLYTALLLSILVYSFWTFIAEWFYFKGNAVFIFLLCWYIWTKDKKDFASFALMEFSFAWLIKEMFLDPTKLYLFESLNIVFVPLIWYFKYGKYNRVLERNISHYWRGSFIFFRKKISKNTGEKK